MRALGFGRVKFYESHLSNSDGGGDSGCHFVAIAVA